MYYLTFILKFDITNTSPFTFYCGILSPIPSDRKTISNPINEPNENIERLLVLPRSPLIFTYKVKALPRRAISRWECCSSNDYRWSDIFTLPFASSKVLYLQYGIIHRVLGTNSFLYKPNCRYSPLCSFCNEENETSETFSFGFAPLLFSFLLLLLLFWNNVFHLSVKLVLLVLYI